MQYRLDKYGNELSVLGFGCLRFPQKNGKIDLDATRAHIKLAIDAGINYFDTAPYYCHSNSEVAVGSGLKPYRDKVLISKYTGTEVKVDGAEYTIVRQNDILAIVE